METKTAGEHTQGAVNLYDKILNSCTDKRFTEFSLPITNEKFAIATNKMIMCKVPLNLIEAQECKTDESLFSTYERFFKNVYLQNGDEPKTKIQVDEVNRILNVCPIIEIDINKSNKTNCEECKGMGNVFFKYVTTSTSKREYELDGDCPICDGSGFHLEKETSTKIQIDKEAIIKFGLNYYTMVVFSKILEASRLLENPVEVVFQKENCAIGDLFKVGKIEFLAMPFAYKKGVSRSTFYEI